MNNDRNHTLVTKIVTPCFPLLLLTLAAGVCASCSEEWDDDDPIKVKDITVTVKEDGTIKNATHFSVVDSVDFYVDYVKYTLSNGELEVTGYNNKRLCGDVNIMSKLHYQDNIYEVTSIGDKAFSPLYHRGGDNITSIHIPNTVTKIGHYAFTANNNLKAVSIGNGLKSIGKSAFFGCTDLTSICIPQSLESIGSSAFYGCQSLSTITIPQSVKEMGEGVFSGCYFASDHFVNLSACTSPTNWDVTLVDVETNDGLLIRNDTIVKCRKYASAVTIPLTVTTIRECAFVSTVNLTAIQIPNSVTSIEWSAFNNCKALAHVFIGDAVTRISQGAFDMCPLTLVECQATKVPYSDNDPFRGYQSNATLRVPAESLDLYRNAEYWKDFATIEALE